MRALQDPMLSGGGTQPEERTNVLGPPFRPDTEREIQPSLSSAPLFHPSPAVPTSHDIASQSQPPLEPATVAPLDVHPLTLNPAAVFPSNLTTGTEIPLSGRRLPSHQDLFTQPPEFHIGAATDATNESGDESSDAEDLSRVSYPTEVKEYAVTLPFNASRRPHYDDMILEARPDIEEFCSVFHNEVLRTPKPSSVHKIEKLFLKLLDACDYPAELNTQSLKTMSPKEIQKYAFESNSKYAFIWELLHLVQDVLDMKILIVARSEKILFLLQSLLLADGYAYSRIGLRDMQEGHAKWPINVVLSLPNQALAERPSDFDLIIGFDYEFKRSNIASRLAETNSGEIKQPMVLQLVIAHSIEHLDLAITERDPDMPSFDHKNAIVIGLTKLRRLILNPDTGRELPHQTAERFANQLKHYDEDFVWEPISLPDEILNFYLESSQPSQPPLELESLQSRKRKLVSGDEMRIQINTHIRA